MKVLNYSWSDFIEGLKVPSVVFEFLNRAKVWATKMGQFLYLAGGPVRDVLLGRQTQDIDLVLEGSWESLLSTLSKEIEFKIISKSQFLTYKLSLNSLYVLDLVTARKEFYPSPASLPVVARGSFIEDIHRRDFTINALIYGLTPPYEDKILDLVEGLSDLKKGLIRPLHQNSFIDDPTRAFRGVRYKVRFNFSYTEEFNKALELAAKISSFKKLSPSRLAQELKLFFTKEAMEALPTLLRDLQNLRLLQRVGLKERRIKSSDFNLLRKAKEELDSKNFEKFVRLFLVELEETTLKRLAFSDRERALILKWAQFLREVESSLQDLSILERVELLEKIPPFLLFRLGLEEKWEDTIELFWDHWRKVKPAVTGEELKALGIKEGKVIGSILKRLRQEKLEGRLTTIEEERAFVRNLIFPKS
ncbi:MAG: hypothetical protein N2327_02595 [Caldimicrobium sp.]|nr:hypothetical protein [Caldimicrobium sp.]MCX7873310.1 hypothetical protein [Caldimicrobium sp.]MDW8093452.1 hypothetical protein [Caldimicrobium sp.]